MVYGNHRRCVGAVQWLPWQQWRTGAGAGAGATGSACKGAGARRHAWPHRYGRWRQAGRCRRTARSTPTAAHATAPPHTRKFQVARGGGAAILAGTRFYLYRRGEARGPGGRRRWGNDDDARRGQPRLPRRPLRSAVVLLFVERSKLDPIMSPSHYLGTGAWRLVFPTNWIHVYFGLPPSAASGQRRRE